MGGSEMKGRGSSTWQPDNSSQATNCIKLITTCHHVGFLPLTVLVQGQMTPSQAHTLTQIHTYGAS